MSKIVIVYFSRKGENYWSGGLRELAKGNTQVVAETIQKAVGGDIFEIETVKSYSNRYHECTKEAKEELRKKERVEVKKFKDNLENYDIIFVGYPNWWGTMPMVMFTFLEKYNLSSKTVIPFCTHEGSGMGVSERDLKSICVGANLLPGLAIRGSEASTSSNKVSTWAKKVI